MEGNMLNEFKKFIAKGNVMDMAVGIIIGAAFTAIVKSMVADLINPIISVFTGGVDFTNLFVVLGDEDFASLAEAKDAGVAVFAYGSFVMAVLNFLIIAWVVFLLIKAVNKAEGILDGDEEEAVPAEPAGPTDTQLLTEIRDALVKP